MTRRIKKNLQAFFDKHILTPKEQYFIRGCLVRQMQHPQLTNAQWNIVLSIEEKYRANPNLKPLEEKDCQKP